MKFNMAAAQNALNSSNLAKYQSRKWQGWLVVTVCCLAAGIGHYVDPEFVLSLIGLATVAYQYMEHRVDVAKATPEANKKLIKTVEKMHKQIEELEKQLNGNQPK